VGKKNCGVAHKVDGRRGGLFDRLDREETAWRRDGRLSICILGGAMDATTLVVEKTKQKNLSQELSEG
jgi:hypothetical protein